MNNEISRLKRAGYAIFFIAHTKLKDQVDVLSGDKYEKLTNNLNNDIFSNFADKAQMVVNVTLEREIVDGKQIGATRRMYFRENPIVDAKSRFDGLPEKLDFSVENFMNAFELGVKNAHVNGITDEELKKKREKEVADMAKMSEVYKDAGLEKSPEDMIAEIKELYGKAKQESRDKAVKIVSDEGKTTFTELSVDKLKEVIEALQ